jgi:hypothetical protein
MNGPLTTNQGALFSDDQNSFNVNINGPLDSGCSLIENWISTPNGFLKRVASAKGVVII